MADCLSYEELRRTVQRLSHPHLRRKLQLSWLEGGRPFLRAVQHQRRLHAVVICERLLKSTPVKQQVRQLRRDGCCVIRVSPEQFRLLSRTPRASGIGIIVQHHWEQLEPCSPDEPCCWIAVSRMRSAGNLGSILRTAEAAGAAGLIVMDPRTDPFDPDVLRGSMGSVLSIPIVRASLAHVRDWARQHQLALIATSPAGQNLYEAVLPQRCVLLLGEERGGLTVDELAACGQAVGIPMATDIDSLNVAVAPESSCSSIDAGHMFGSNTRHQPLQQSLSREAHAERFLRSLKRRARPAPRG